MRRERKTKLTNAELRAAGVSKTVVVRKIRREENAIQDMPGALRFGSANVSDTPLSAGEEQPATVVIPGGRAEGRGERVDVVLGKSKPPTLQQGVA